MSHLRRGYTGTFLTFMFNALAGNENAKKKQMFEEVERCYALLLTRAYRDLKKIDTFDMPLWLASPDWPVPKIGFNRDRLLNIQLNDGLHMHAIALLPPGTRVGARLDMHIDDHQQLYRPPHGKIMKMNFAEMTATPEKVVGYGLKSITRRRIDPGDVLILPRSHSEMPTMTKTERRFAEQERRSLKAEERARWMTKNRNLKPVWTVR